MPSVGSSTASAEVLVVGVGGAGASALHALATRGVSAIGIDRFDPGHDRGSSHGDTRIIRKAYFEHPDYVPLVERAYSGWRALEAETDEALFDPCGLVLTGRSGSEVIAGVDLAARTHGVPVETWSRADAAERVPWLRVPDDHEIRWEPDGGHLRVEACVRAHARRAVALGARLQTGEQVLGWDAGEHGVTVRTDRATYTGDRLVLCPGAWSTTLLGEVGALAGLHVLRKVLLWLPHAASSRLPDTVFFVDSAHGAFYGFPSVDGATVKVAEHSGGEPVADPSAVDRALHDADVAPAARFAADVLPGLEPSPARHAVCMYTMTRDAHFVIDRHPAHANVAIAAGFSGHGYKFMSAVGPILADLAIEGTTDAPIGFLGLDRFS